LAAFANQPPGIGLRSRLGNFTDSSRLVTRHAGHAESIPRHEVMMIVNGPGRFRRRAARRLAGMLLAVIFTVAFAAHSGAALACCTIPPPPPCETHPEMCV
jgi:heme A synthase